MFGGDPGPVLAGVLAGADLAGLDDDALIEAMAAFDRVSSWAAAGSLAAVAVLAARRRPEPGEITSDHGPGGCSRYVADEVAAALTLSRPAADGRIAVAIDLADRLPGTRAALQAGRLDPLRARVISEQTDRLSDANVAVVEARLLPRAETMTVGRLRAAVDRAVLAVDPPSTQEHIRAQVEDRRVAFTADPQNGMAQLWANLPAADGARLWQLICQLARTGKTCDDPRTADQRRADALSGLAGPARATVNVTGPATPADPATPAGTVLGLTIAESTLRGADEQPAQLAGYGPLDATTARRLASTPGSRTIPDPASTTTAGTSSYQPSAALRRHILARDQTCRFPGCRQPAHHCDVDHTTPWPTGPTTPDNLGTLCGHHHRLKHQTRWRLAQPTPGTFTWTSPTGHTYTVAPDTS